MRYMMMRKKAVAAAALLFVFVLSGALTLTGVLPWTLALQATALGAIGLGTASLLLLLRRVDLRIRDVHRSVHGGDQLMTARDMARISGRAKEARQRAGVLHAEGRIQEAVDELVPYAALDDTADLARRRMLSERRALGPITGLPERTTATFSPVSGRILHLVTNALPNTQAGYTVRTHRIVTAQREAGLDPHVVTFVGWPTMDDGDTSVLREVDGIPYHRILPGKRFLPGLQERIDAAVPEVTELVKRLRPAVLHAASDHKNATVALHVGRELGIPVVYELRGFLEETWLSHEGAPSRRGSERHRLLVERESSVLREADAVVTLARTMREEIVHRGVAPERIVLSPNAVDDSLLRNRPDGRAYRASLGISSDETVIGSVSSLTHYEGFDTLIDAAVHLRGWGHKVRVLLVGDGAVRPDLLEQVKRLGLGSLCLLPGSVGPEEALRAQAALDVMVVPRIDARVSRLVTPLKPVEAMALGTPVVASDLPALRELLADGRAGTLVPAGDAVSLADAVVRLAKDDCLREQQVKAAHEEVLAHRTWARNAQVYRDLYERLGAFA
ncbi:glycosyltransferase WbuB [Nocardiopsis terrae]|uniref:Glycosyltransferase involved in cell wall biosynthesis n=1 Tax=Nocardiopsis terrae TaxID=372655 RepID=A0ABR9HGF7_9ACTN|nr:glycosyltransferase family 4 protein [Nocardiopsis terrae]MBE1457890.1 glycosyltransferase involved in cell wall biosynthesis [Nocardiopsis terrae]GHC83692.1 glycosyltransferase WbuB [Nocardiopsis terrae]